MRDKALKETPDMDGRPPKQPWEYRCCQGYVPKCCCLDFPNMFAGQHECLYVEGCCCPVLSLSITRIFLMDKLHIHPDPGDYQLIQFSNCMQMLSCICWMAAFVDRNFEQLAHIIDLIADIVTLSVAGCMCVQINDELNDKMKYANGVANAGVQIAPGNNIIPVAVAEPISMSRY